MREVFRRDLSHFGRMFLRLNYSDIKNTRIQTVIMARVAVRNESCYSFTDNQIHTKTGEICTYCNVNNCT